MKKKSCIVILLLLCVFVFTGCTNPDGKVEKVVVNGTVADSTYGEYRILSNLDQISIYLRVSDNVKSYKVEYDIVPKNNSSITTENLGCENATGNFPVYKLDTLESNYKYSVRFILYNGESCSGATVGNAIGTTIYTYPKDSSNEKYISVEKIKEKLGDWSYKNKSNGVEKSCASYGIEDKEENVPLCVALARVSADAPDCARFLKSVYYRATGVEPSSIYGRGTELATYTSSTAQIPSGLKDGDLITFYNNGSWAHIAMVFYWDDQGGWHTVSGGMSGKVKVYTLQETLDKSNAWTKYVYRSQ